MQIRKPSMLTNAEVVRGIDKRLRPWLKANGLFLRKGRSYYCAHQSGVLCFVSQAVGAYFQAVTKTPSMSFSANLVFKSKEAISRETLISEPLSWADHESLELNVVELAVNFSSEEQTPEERKRRDLWKPTPDGQNLDALLDDLACSVNAVDIVALIARSSAGPRKPDQIERAAAALNSAVAQFWMARASGDVAGTKHWFDQAQTLSPGRLAQQAVERGILLSVEHESSLRDASNEELDILLRSTKHS